MALPPPRAPLAQLSAPVRPLKHGPGRAGAGREAADKGRQQGSSVVGEARPEPADSLMKTDESGAEAAASPRPHRAQAGKRQVPKRSRVGHKQR